MKIIIPMTGLGQRFVDAGYKTLKPLIEIDGRTIIEHVIDLFPGEEDFLFIVREDACKEYQLENFLLGLKPKAQVKKIAGHKLGPVYAVAQAFEEIDDNDSVIVNYCDFNMYWDFKHFKKTVEEINCDGAIPCYTGFHPHLLHEKNFYASCLTDENGFLLDIKEKSSHTINKQEGYHSVGTYYFRNALIMKKYFQSLMQQNYSLNGEFYVSMVYDLLIKDKLDVFVYDQVPFFCQWGTPEDFQEYEYWHGIFSSIGEKKEFMSSIKQEGKTLIPMAGDGSRFVKEGYDVPKPLIKVNEKPMVISAVDSLPTTQDYIFICRDFHIREYSIDREIKKYYQNASIVSISQLTEGQACTCLLGKEYINNNQELFIAASDNSMIYNQEKFLKLKEQAEVIVFSFRNNVTVVPKPEQYGWLVVDEDDNVIKASVKVPISDDPMKDHAIVGAFWFKNGSSFVSAAQVMIENNKRVNNEFYVDEVINDLIAMNFKVKVFEIDYYICWGTPNDLKTYEYWNSYFNQKKALTI